MSVLLPAPLRTAHQPEWIEYRPVVAVRHHGGKATPIRRTRYTLDCSCGAHLGSRLDYIDLRRRWEAHKEAVRSEAGLA